MFDRIWTKIGGVGGAGKSLENERRGAFSGWPMVIGWLAMLTFAFYASTHMVAAGDTWVAMACGRHFVHHGVNTVEPFSANSHKAGPTAEEVATWPKWAQWITDKVGLDTVRYWHPTGWINQNWLTHVMFYWLSTTLGSEQDPYFDALILWKFAIYFLVVICLYGTARILGVNRVLAAVLSCFAMFVGRSLLDVRPAGFSNLLVAVFLLILALTSYRNALYIWLIVPLIVFWANVHGGYVYAFIALVPFVVWHIIMRLPKRWTVAMYSMTTWVVIAAMANRFLQHEYLESIPFVQDWVFYLLLTAVVTSVALTVFRKVSDGGVVAFHTAASAILFLLFLTRFSAVPPVGLNRYGQEIFATYAASSRLAFLGIFSFALVLGIVLASAKDQVGRVMERKAIVHTVAAGLVAFVAMVVFNPFHLTNLTHTFVVSVSKHAERWRDVHEWHRAFDWTNPVGTAIPFLVMYTVAWLCLLTWAIVLVRTARAVKPPAKKRANAIGDFVWPKMDLALLVIAAMTVYMAIRSRRFIPIAAYAACPIMALLIEQFVTFVLTLVNLRQCGRTLGPGLGPAVGRGLVLGLGGALVVLVVWRAVFWPWLFLPVPGHSNLVQPRLWLTMIGVVLAFSAFPLSAAFSLSGRRKRERAQDEMPGYRAFVQPTYWVAVLLLSYFAIGFTVWVGLKFKRVYLDYWPADPEFKSVFMRMTASDAKPFYACQFIRDNELSGNMFNYWTEGGFIAWGQTPDPNTGRTPLQLFMDGRAQAAYDRRTFDLWTDIMTGGTAFERAARTGTKLDARDYLEIGDWVTGALDEYDVWVVLMPAGQFSKPFVTGLDYSPDWRVVFLNNKQRLYVNVKTEKGRALFEGMFTGTTVYPNDYLASFALGHNLLLFKDPAQKMQGLDKVIKAFDLNPSPAPMLDLLLATAQAPELRPRVGAKCRAYADDFEQNKNKYMRTDGYNLRLEAARLALVQLEGAARAQRNIEEADAFADRMNRYIAERDSIAEKKRW